MSAEHKPHSDLFGVLTEFLTRGHEGRESERAEYESDQEEALAALDSIEEQYERLTQRPEWVTCDYQPEKREDDPGGRSCTEAINFYANELAGLKEQYQALLDAIVALYEDAEHDHARAGMLLTLRQDMGYALPSYYDDPLPTSAVLREVLSGSNPAISPGAIHGQATLRRWTENDAPDPATELHECPYCDGRGWNTAAVHDPADPDGDPLPEQEQCATCGGSGEVSRPATEAPLIQGGSIKCGECGALVGWEGEPPGDCLRCGAPTPASEPEAS